MPIPAKELVDATYISLMVEADSKVGKSRSIGQSLIKAFGAIYIIECGTSSALKPLHSVTQKFEYDLVREESDMENAIRAARKGVEADKYKAIFLDDYNLFASALQVELAKKMAGASGNSDGRAVWWEYRKRVLNICHRLMDVEAHFVMACHPGSFLGKAGNDIPGVFDDVVWMTKNNKGERIFQINGDTEPGRGSRSIQGEHKIEADVGVFWKLAQMNSDQQQSQSRQGQKAVSK